MEIKSYEILSNYESKYRIRINDTFDIVIEFVDDDISDSDEMVFINQMLGNLTSSNDNLLRAFYFTFGELMAKAGLLPVNSGQGDNDEQD